MKTKTIIEECRVCGYTVLKHTNNEKTKQNRVCPNCQACQSIQKIKEK